MSEKTDRLKRILASVPIIASMLAPNVAQAEDPTASPTTAPLNEPADSMAQWQAFIEFRDELASDPQLTKALFHDTEVAANILEERVYHRLLQDGVPPGEAQQQVQMVSQVLDELAALDAADRQFVFDMIKDDPTVLTSSAVAAIVAAVAVALAVKVAAAVQSAAAVQAAVAFANVLVWVNAVAIGSGDGGDVGDEAGDEFGDGAEFGDEFGDEFGEGAEENGDLNEDDWSDDDIGHESDGADDLLEDGGVGGDDVIVEGPWASNAYPSEPGVVLGETVAAALSKTLSELSDYRQRTLLRRILSSSDSVARRVKSKSARHVTYEYRGKQLAVLARYDRRRHVYRVLDVKVT